LITGERQVLTIENPRNIETHTASVRSRQRLVGEIIFDRIR
jgi:hypothetical protein